MDHRECKFQLFDICYRLFHFVMKILSSKGQETVTLGSSVLSESNVSFQEIDSYNHRNESHDKSSQEPADMSNSDHSVLSLVNDPQEERKELHLAEENSSRVTPSPSHIEDKNDLNANVEQKVEEEKAPLTFVAKRAPKKIVSIKETVEDIDSIMKQRRKSKGTKRSKSFDLDNGNDGSVRPSRSILKVGSNINDKSDSLNSLNGVG